MSQMGFEDSSVSEAPASSADLPLVSIIIITYNDRQHVGEAIDSALAQTYANCEIIVVDDGSTDGTGRFIAEQYGDRVRYVWKENGGMGSARSAGLEIASGKYIQHLDSDDILLPHKVETQVTYLEAHRDLAFVYGRTLCFWDDDCPHTWEHKANELACSGCLLDEFLQHGNFVNVATPLFRRDWLDHIGGWDPSATVHDDQDIMLRLAYSGAEGHFLDGEPVLLYRRRRVPFDPTKHETWRSSVIKFKGQAYVWDKLRRAMLADGSPEWPLVERRMGLFEFWAGWWYYRGGNRKSAVGWMLKGLRHNRQRPLYKFIFLVSAIFLPSPWLWVVKDWFVDLISTSDFGNAITDLRDSDPLAQR